MKPKTFQILTGILLMILVAPLALPIMQLKLKKKEIIHYILIGILFTICIVIDTIHLKKHMKKQKVDLSKFPSISYIQNKIINIFIGIFVFVYLILTWIYALDPSSEKSNLFLFIGYSLMLILVIMMTIFYRSG